MKKKILTLISGLLICGLSACFFSSCDKDTTCYVEVHVTDGLTQMPVNGAFVKIDIDSSAVNASGYTNPKGIFETSFTSPAIFNVVATNTVPFDSVISQSAEYILTRKSDIIYKGQNTIRLKEGETVIADVALMEYKRVFNGTAIDTIWL